jgi:hypothetical protein
LGTGVGVGGVFGRPSRVSGVAGGVANTPAFEGMLTGVEGRFIIWEDSGVVDDDDEVVAEAVMEDGATDLAVLETTRRVLLGAAGTGLVNVSNPGVRWADTTTPVRFKIEIGGKSGIAGGARTDI